MSESWTEQAVQGPGTAGFRRRFLLLLLLYSCALCALLAVSWFFLLPQLLMVRFQGAVLPVAHLPEQHRRLQAELTTYERERLGRLDVIHDPLDGALRAERAALPTVTHLLAVLAVEAERRTGEGRKITLERIEFDRGARHAVLHGAARAGTQSLTALAEFLDALGELPFVEELSHAPLTRSGTVEGEFHAPFRIELQLRAPSPVSS